MRLTSTSLFILLFVFLLLSSAFLLSFGNYDLNLLKILSSPLSQVESLVFWEVRFPRLMTAILSSSLLAFSGLLMQSYFQNPIVGPYILGVQSGASFGVAIFVMLGMSFNGSVVFSASLGAISTLAFILFCSRYLKQKVLLLILGLLLGQLFSGSVSLMALFSGADELRSFVLWGLGSFDRISINELKTFVPLSLFLLSLCFLFIKPLNLLLLGEQYAQSLGLNLSHMKWMFLLLAGLMTAIVSAYCGPIAFIGLIIPHLTRALFKSHDHKIILPGAMLLASIVGVCVQILSLAFSPHVLPINTVLGVLSAPALLYFLLSKKGAGHVLQ